MAAQIAAVVHDADHCLTAAVTDGQLHAQCSEHGRRRSPRAALLYEMPARLLATTPASSPSIRLASAAWATASPRPERLQHRYRRHADDCSAMRLSQ